MFQGAAGPRGERGREGPPGPPGLRGIDGIAGTPGAPVSGMNFHIYYKLIKNLPFLTRFLIVCVPGIFSFSIELTVNKVSAMSI